MGEIPLSGANGRENPWLDLIRSMAILLVLLRHGERALNSESGAPQGILQTIFMNGWVGVDLFFVLSGYLIARHLVRAGIDSGRFRLGRYLAMRALRIVPAYYAVLFLVASGAFPLFYVAPEALGFRVGYHLLFLQDYLPSDINVVFWSLGVEEKFYLLAPVLMLVLLRRKTPVWWLLAMLFLAPSAFRAFAFLGMGSMDYPEFWRVFRSPFHMTLEGLLVGVAIAVAERAGFIRRAGGSGLLLLVGATGLLAAWLGTHDLMANIGAADVFVQPPMIAVLTGATVLGAVQLATVPMPLAGSFRVLARLSYSLYLVHYPLIPLAAALSAWGGVPGFWLCYIAVSLVASVVLHLGVEAPFLVWKDRLARRSVSPSSDPTVGPADAKLGKAG